PPSPRVPTPTRPSMDSLTQLALGAAVGDAVLGSRGGRRAIVWGAVLGTLPDLDVLVRSTNDLAAFTEHRSWSHSVFILTALTPIVAFALRRLHRNAADATFLRWSMFAWLVFVTHVVLDCFTSYGTQILWPLPSPPVAWASIFIIDPLYTLPLCVGVVVSWRRRSRAPASALRWNLAGLAVSTLYLGWTVVAQSIVTARAEVALARDGIDPTTVFVTPTPFNSLLWRVVAIDDEGFVEGVHSLVADGSQIAFERHYDGRPDRRELADIPAFERLDWFTRGVISVEIEHDRAVIVDLRMGAEGSYPFRFEIAERTESRFGMRAPSTWQAIEPRKLDFTFDWDRLRSIWPRIVGHD
ncbi:MAG: metal-dependent hydrolase, partial [Planctomycetes bacterium]|nr:metal-dependent hydrolase [Planctomycetota bacterium]